MKVLIFADITDPWSYIGATRFERAAAMFSILTGEPIEFTLRAFQLEPDASSDGRLLMDVNADELGGADKLRKGKIEYADGEGSRLTLFLETRHGTESDHDVAATLDAIRMLVEAEV